MAHVNMDALVDKLCERLAVETGGVGIYRAAIAKIDDPTIAVRLEHFMQEEAEHRDLLEAYLTRLGVEDRETPSARLARHEGEAFLALIGEADTPGQVLNIMLTIELMDENGWEMIINLGRDLGDDQLVRTLDRPLQEEKEHLRGVRGMLAQINRELVMTGEATV
ncbi:MAG TPA: ferritin-like domain-containing protein [Polyangia bacterium]|jgi:rubrerythrin|nr:ferritin-like domain-containing protein [Polyangia bacterium]